MLPTRTFIGTAPAYTTHAKVASTQAETLLTTRGLFLDGDVASTKDSVKTSINSHPPDCSGPGNPKDRWSNVNRSCIRKCDRAPNGSGPSCGLEMTSSRCFPDYSRNDNAYVTGNQNEDKYF
jgi:hypothetical protein